VLDLRRRRAHWPVRRRLSRRPRSAGPVSGAKAAGLKKTEVAQPKAETVKRGGNKLSYNLQRELEQLPQKLEELEAELQTLQEQVADPFFLWPTASHTQQVLAQLAEAEQALEAAFERWEYLEGLKNGA
jgi:ATP-binding cassette subfamily F protein uup